jgi:starch synthase
LPLVHRVGGLADTVNDASLENMAAGRATGLVFERHTESDFSRALERAVALAQQPALWQQVQGTAMAQRFDWRDAARQYMALYRCLTTSS